MHIVNRSKRKLYWMAYRAGDDTHLAPLKDKEGWLAPDHGIDLGMGEHAVQLRVGSSYREGPVYKGAFVNTQTVIINGREKPILLDDTYKMYANVALGADRAKGRAALEEMNTVTDRTVSLVRTVVQNLPAKLAPVKALAGVMLMLLVDEPRAKPDPPTLDEIKDAVAEVVANDTAKQQSAAIMTTWYWLDEFTRVTNALKASGQQPSDYEVAKFDANLDVALGPNSQFLIAMERLHSDDKARRFAVPAYLLGIALFAQLKTIAIGRSGLLRPVIPEDFDALRVFLDRSIKALEKTKIDLNDDYGALLKKYEIGQPEVGPLITGFNIKAIGVATDNPPWYHVDNQRVVVSALRDDVKAQAEQAGAAREPVPA